MTYKMHGAQVLFIKDLLEKNFSFSDHLFGLHKNHEKTKTPSIQSAKEDFEKEITQIFGEDTYDKN
jgi:hypothetical protein